MQLTDWIPRDAFHGHTVFITGGGSGINLGIAKTYAQVGASVAICGRSQERLDAAIVELREYGNPVFAQAADVRDYDALAAAIDATGRELGPIKTLICGAAGNFLSRPETLSPNGFKTVVDIDLNGSFNACRAAFEQLKASRGAIIFISGGQSLAPFSGQVHVGAAKAGVDSLMRNLALEWGQFGIRSNVIMPGPIDDTEGMKRLAATVGQETWKGMIPLGRFGSVEEIGAMAAILSSPLAAFVTGTSIQVDGGIGLAGPGRFNQAFEDALQNS